MDLGSGVRPSTGFKIKDVTCHETLFEVACRWFFWIIMIAIVLAAMVSGWIMERKLNWKLSYGPKVEKRIGLIERRVEILEGVR